MTTELLYDNRKTILFLSWRDIKAPKAGGAEIFTHEMLKNSDHTLFRFIHFSCACPGLKDLEFIDGITYIRKGSSISVISEARKFYKLNNGKIDFVVDQCNTHQFFTPLWVEWEKRIFFIHQLTREIWFQQMKFPMNLAGYAVESRLLKLHSKDKTITVSKSTADELTKLGFKSENITILPEGLSFSPWEMKRWQKKDNAPVFVFVGRYSKYKGIRTAIRALAGIKRSNPGAVLWLVGKPNPAYVTSELIPLCNSFDMTIGCPGENPDVVIWGFVSEEKKLELMSKARALVFPSVREGWGLIISEAAAVGTPGIVFDAPGTRDAVDYGRSGYMCAKNTVEELVRLMKTTVKNSDLYKNMQIKAYAFASKLSWVETGARFTEFLKTQTMKQEGHLWVM